MANKEQLTILKQGVRVWNKWRDENPEERIDLSRADLSNSDLAGVYLSFANLRGTNLSKARLGDASLKAADLTQANLSEANLMQTYLRNATMTEANFTEAFVIRANISQGILNYAKLTAAKLIDVNLEAAELIGADLTGAYLTSSNLQYANLSQAKLINTNLTNSTLVATKIDKAILSGSLVYGTSVWDIEGEFEEQKDLIITPEDSPAITVDNIKVAQFIYLILNNKEIRDVINTLTSKSVLILGRFAIPERKAILDALRNKLREYDLLPIVFDFERPTDRDFTETIKTLAGVSYFVIADITNPKSSPLELQAIVPDYQIPFVPIIQEGEKAFAMFDNLQSKYDWVLSTKTYDSVDTLIHALKPGIIDPAVEMCNKLRLIKAKKRTTESLRDYLDKSL